jgi:hypothetical protein
LRIGSGAVVGDPGKARCTGQGISDTPVAVGRIGHIAYQLPRLLGAFDHRNQNGLRACVQHLFHQIGFAHRDPDNRVTGRGGKDLKLGQDRPQVVGRMFAINQKPVEPGGAHQFRAEGVGKAKPAAKDGFARAEGLFERVHGLRA